MLARGGMAVVYLVRQPALDREVVLKRLDLESDDPTLAQRFVREARLAAALDHPNVVTLFDFFEDDGVPYIAMEYVAGGSLRSLVGALELPQVLGVLEGTLAGLAHAERARDRAPRPQAGERAAHAAREREDRRLRHRARVQRAEPAPHGHRQGDGDAGVHGAGAGARRARSGRTTDLYALGRDRLRAARRASAVRGRHADGRPLLPRPQAAAAARRARAAAGRLARVGRVAAREVAGGPAAVRRGGVARARGDRGRRARPVLAARGRDHVTDRSTRGGGGGRGARRATDERGRPEDAARADAAAPGAGAAAARPRRRRSSCRRRSRGVLAVAAVGLIISLPDDEPRPAAPDRETAGRPAGRRPLRFRRQRRGRNSSRRMLGARAARLAPAQRRGARATRPTAGRRSPRRTPACPAGAGRATSSAPASRAGTSTATARPTSRSARRGATASPSSTAPGAGCAAGRRTQLRGAAPIRLQRSLADDMNGDGYDDLIAAAPGHRRGARRGAAPASAGRAGSAHDARARSSAADRRDAPASARACGPATSTATATST